MRKYRKSPERSRKTVLMSTFKNDLPENQFVLMNTVRRTQIFTAGLLNLDGHYIFPFSHSEETQKAKPAVWNSATAVKQWNIIQKELTNFQIMARVFLSTHLIQWWWFQLTMKTDVCFLGIWSHYEMEALTKALLVPNIWQIFFSQKYFWLGKQSCSEMSKGLKNILCWHCGRFSRLLLFTWVVQTENCS